MPQSPCQQLRRLTVTGEYWAVNQILAKQLHTTNEDILRYTTNLMDKLEQVRMLRNTT